MTNLVKENTLDRYEENLLGYPVLLENVVIERQYEDGEVTYEIPDLDGLTAAVAVARALLPLQLSAPEIKFLRKAMGKTAKQLADDMESSPETVSRWERDQQMGGFAEKLLRELVFAELKDKAPGVSVPDHAVAYMKVKRRAEGNTDMPKFVFTRHLMLMKGDGIERKETWDCLKEAA